MLPINYHDISEQSPAEKAIIATALNLFIVHNESQINVTKLLNAAGINKSSFYKLFANMDDVYAAILLTDEISLSPLLKKLRIYGNLSDLLSEYLSFRIQNIERYKVLTRLETHLHKNKVTLDRFESWQKLRRNHVDEFTSIVESKLTPDKSMDKENIRFYYGLVWSIASGIGQLSDSDFFHELILDRRGFNRFIIDSVQTVGEKK